MDLQALAVALIVGASLAYAAWALMPAAWRRALLHRATGRVPAAAGGGCGGCAGGCAAPPQRSASAAADTASAGDGVRPVGRPVVRPVVRPIVLHRSPPR